MLQNGEKNSKNTKKNWVENLWHKISKINVEKKLKNKKRRKISKEQKNSLK